MKRERIKVTFRYGIGNEITREYKDGMTLNEVIQYDSPHLLLGATDKAVFYLLGCRWPGYMRLRDGDVLIIQEEHIYREGGASGRTYRYRKPRKRKGVEDETRN